MTDKRSIWKAVKLDVRAERRASAWTGVQNGYMAVTLRLGEGTLSGVSHTDMRVMVRRWDASFRTVSTDWHSYSTATEPFL